MTGRGLRGYVEEVLRRAIRDLEEDAVLVRKVVLAGLDLLDGGGGDVAGVEAVGVAVSGLTAGDVLCALVSTFGRSSGAVGGFLAMGILKIALPSIEAVFTSLFFLSASNFAAAALFSSAA